MLDSIDEYMNVLHQVPYEDPIKSAERFVAEAVTQAASPIDKPIDADKVVLKTNKWVKPVKLSNLRKVLGKFTLVGNVKIKRYLLFIRTFSLNILIPFLLFL